MVSIIIPVFNKVELTKQCIDSIMQKTDQKKTRYEIIVIDNGSTDGTFEYLQECCKKYNRFKMLRNIENLGFPKAMNQGVSIAEGDYFMLLNNDTILTNKWLEKMLRKCKSSDNSSIVSCYTNNCAGVQMIKGVPPLRNQEETDKICADIYSKNILKSKELDALIFFAVLIPRIIWVKVGGLDEDFTPGNFEDNYFCYRSKELGYKCLVAHCFINHLGSASWKQDFSKYAPLIAKNQRIYYNKIAKSPTISLSMIVSDDEDPEILKRCIKSIYLWVEEINIVFNFKKFKNNKKHADLFEAVLDAIGDENKLELNTAYLKWTNFSDMRNKSLDMATQEYVLWLDADDVMYTPERMRLEICNTPDVDGFNCMIESLTHFGSVENIIHNRLLRNKKEYRFTNDVHEDIVYSMVANNAITRRADIIIQHLGNMDATRVADHNKRNLKILTKEYKEKKNLSVEEDPSKSLRYFHLVNCYILEDGTKNIEKAISLVDECFEKCDLKDTDPLTPKMWVLRGHACHLIGAIDAAKSDFLKSWGTWKHPDACVNLAAIYINAKDYDSALKVLEEMYKMESFEVTNIPVDMVSVEKKLLKNLGTCYLEKMNQIKENYGKDGQDKKQQMEQANEYVKLAEKVLQQYMLIEAKDLLVFDKLLHIMKITGRTSEAVEGSFNAVEIFPNYDIGWLFLGQAMLLQERYRIAHLYFTRALQINPNSEIAKTNIKNIEDFFKMK